MMDWDWSVRIRRNRETGNLFYTPRDLSIRDSQGLPTNAVEWDGSGIAFVGEDVMVDRLLQSRPEIGDVIELGGHNYVVIERVISMRGYRVMRESLAAHRLALFYLTYWSDLEASLWATRAFTALHWNNVADVEERCLWA